MSINRLVSVNNVIINLMDDLGLNHNKHKAMFVNWATMAEKNIGSFYQLKRQHAVLDICGCVAELPCNAVYLQRAIIGDWGQDCSNMFNNVCGLLNNVSVTVGNIDSTSFLVVDLPPSFTAESGNFSFGFAGHHVQDNKIIFDINRDGQKVTIQFLGFEVDSDGIPLVGENHLEAIAEYCMWKYRRRIIRSGVDLGVARDHEQRWNMYAARSRGDDGELSETDRIKIVDMLHDPYVGRGLQLVPTLGNYYYGLF